MKRNRDFWKKTKETLIKFRVSLLYDAGSRADFSSGAGDKPESTDFYQEFQAFLFLRDDIPGNTGT